MKNLKLIGAIFILLMSVVVSLAQQTVEPKTTTNCEDSTRTPMTLTDAKRISIPIHAGAPTMQFAPEGENTWTVQILTSGGFDGSGKGDLVFTSDGKFSRDQNPLTKNQFITSEALQKITDSVLKVQISEQNLKPLAEIVKESGKSLCSDCYKTTLILFRRDADGTVKTFMTNWDVTTKSQVPEEILQIYENVINFADAGKNPMT